MINLLAAAIMIFFSLSRASVVEKPMCVPTRLSAYSTQLRTNHQILTIIKFNHPLEDQQIRLKAFLTNALDAAERRDCAGASVALTRAVEDARPALMEALQIIAQLTMIHTAAFLSGIATEDAVEEWPDTLKMIANVRRKLKQIKTACPDETQILVGQIETFALGPEAWFAMSVTPNLPLIPAESQALRIANELQMDQVAIDPFDFGDHRISDDGQRALDQILVLMYRQESIPDGLIASVVSFETDPTTRAAQATRLRETLRKLAIVVDGAYRRNTFIVERLLETPGNVALVIGYKHVDNMVQQLVDRCRQVQGIK